MSIIIEGESEMQGVIDKKCQYCMNDDVELFHQYFSEKYQTEIVYCRVCIHMTYSSSETYYDLVDTDRLAEEVDYHLTFELTEQQQYASSRIVEAVQQGQKKLLHAVTGAGKTEMILEGIKEGRKRGLNVAIVSPRVDVVKELSLRMNSYFTADIDVLYQGQQIQFDSRFVISTVQQLVKYHHHFGLIIVDEVDAFPLPMDKRLQRTVDRAAAEGASIIYLTATPPVKLRIDMKSETVILPARYHRRALPVPRYQYMSKKQLLQGGLKKYLNRQAATFLLVFFNNIKDMELAAETYRDFSPVTVYASDVDRHEKVEQIRAGDFPIIFTTTILERGFTMASLDVFIMDAGQYTSECLIQMAGRVDRKLKPYAGEVVFFHNGASFSMMQAVKAIKTMNQQAKKRGWID